MSNLVKNAELFHTDRSARRVRTRAPFFNAGFAFVDSAIMSRRVPIDPTSTFHESDSVNCALCFKQTVYKPQDQLSKTNRSEGA